jgi:hypothetical protein
MALETVPLHLGIFLDFERLKNDNQYYQNR